MGKRVECKFCHRLLVEPRGPKDSSLLLVGNYPTWQDLESGYAWTGEGGDVLKKELRRVGINIDLVRCTNFWLHYATNKKEDNYEQEFDFHYSSLINEAKGRKAVLLMGAVPVAFLTGLSIMAIEGTRVKVPHMPDVPIIMAMRNPAQVLDKGATVGNVRFSFERFSGLVKEWI